MIDQNSLIVGLGDILRPALCDNRKVYKHRMRLFFMAWTLLKEGNLLWHLTDGYLEETRIRGPPIRRSEESPEQQMASDLYRRATQSYVRAAVSAQERVYPIDIWIVGSSGWLESSIPESLNSILEGESRDNYRIAIMSERVPSFPHTFGWYGWAREAGMTRKKKHKDARTFKTAGRDLLGKMHAYRIESGVGPSQFLRALRVPVVHHGDSGSKK